MALSTLMPLCALVLLQAAPGARRGAEPPARAASFDQAAQRAASANAAGNAAEAIRWYREGVRQRPSWDEGWWYLGALSYEQGSDSAAVAAFTRFLEIKPEAGPGFALRGLAEFRQKRYDSALRDLARGLALGSVGNAEIRDAVYFHVAILRIRNGEFELAVEPLSRLARDGAGNPGLATACALVLLRLSSLPEAVPADKRELVQAAGPVACSALALREDAGPGFEQLLQRYPKTPHLHYGYGAYLLHKDVPDSVAAIAQFEKEIEVDPGAIYPRLEIAYELIRDGQHARALPYARRAVELAPGLFAAHNALGRALFETGETVQGIAELEKAVQLAPESRQARATLAGAYARVGRSADAEREKTAVRQLDAERGPSSRSSLGTEQGRRAKEENP